MVNYLIKKYTGEALLAMSSCNAAAWVMIAVQALIFNSLNAVVFYSYVVLESLSGVAFLVLIFRMYKKKNAILNAVSWYDASAEKVIKGISKLTADKLKILLEHLDCKETELADYGYFATNKKGEYLEYETESDLRDTENVPIKENIYNYFF